MNTALTLAIEFAKVRMDNNGFKREPEFSLLVKKARLIAARNDQEMAWETGASDASETTRHPQSKAKFICRICGCIERLMLLG
jgi:hypothetical protein